MRIIAILDSKTSLYPCPKACMPQAWVNERAPVPMDKSPLQGI